MAEIIFQGKQKTRLDKFLVDNLPHYSRSQLQKMIRGSNILVNNKTAPVHQFLKAGDKITICDTRPVPNKAEGYAMYDMRQNDYSKPDIIDETDDYLVINKPAGLVVHTAPGVKEPTLADWLIEKYLMIKTVGDDPNRPGLVHRLDKEVSGLMVLTKTQKMFEHLKKQFQEHNIKKEYLALVYGKIEKDEGKIDFPLIRSRLTGRIAAKPKETEGKEAITKFEVIKRFANYTYLKLTLLTGRTHQIRAHLFAYGHPLLGDKLYKNKKLKDKFKLNRIFLHAAILGFYDLNNEWQEYYSTLPVDLETIVQKLS